MLNIDEKLLTKTEQEYGKDYHAHYLEIYKIYVEMADRISIRRQSANSFFLTINTMLVALFGYVQLGNKVGISLDFYWLVSLAGMILCFMWYRLIRSYKDLNSGKFKVIHRIEQNLPLSPYDAEWEALEKGENPKIYLPFTHVEIFIPWVFFFLHFLVFSRFAFLLIFPLN